MAPKPKEKVTPAAETVVETLPGKWKACEACGYDVDPVRENSKGPICENCGRPRVQKEAAKET